MPRYSLDLRTRVLSAYHNREGSIRQLARRFDLSPTTVLSWIQRFRTTGERDAKPVSGGRQRKLDDLSTLDALIRQRPDATLSELVEALYEQTGIRVSPSTLWRYSRALGKSYKKNAPRQ